MTKNNWKMVNDNILVASSGEVIAVGRLVETVRVGDKILFTSYHACNSDGHLVISEGEVQGILNSAPTQDEAKPFVLSDNAKAEIATSYAEVVKNNPFFSGKCSPDKRKLVLAKKDARIKELEAELAPLKELKKKFTGDDAMEKDAVKTGIYTVLTNPHTKIVSITITVHHDMMLDHNNTRTFSWKRGE